MRNISCSCSKRNGEKCGKEVKYKYELINSNEKIVKYSCKQVFHRRSIVSELEYDSILNIYRKYSDNYHIVHNNLTCSKCVDLLDTLFYQPHTKKHTLYINYYKLQRKYHKELEKLEILYPRRVVEKSYGYREKLENEMSVIMIPYVERGDYGKYKTEIDLQNAVNELNIMLLDEIDYLKGYETYFNHKIKKSRDKYINAEAEYIEEFYEVKLVYVNKTEKQCSICMNDINENNGGFLDCGHCFHNGCLEKWIKIKTNCPMCRKHFNKLKIMKSI